MGKGIKIGVDGSPLSKTDRTGVENTAYQIIKHLVRLDLDNKYIIYTRNHPDDFHAPKNTVVKQLKGRPWHSFRLPLALFKDKPNAFLELSNILPSICPEKSIVLLHDFAFKYYPESYGTVGLAKQEKAVERAIKKAKCLLFTTSASREDFYKFYGKKNIHSEIVPLAYDSDSFRPIENPADILKIGKYILFVGRIEHRKNIQGIVKAFELYKEKTKSDLKLVLVGNRGFGFEEIANIIDNSKYNKDIIRPGFIKNEDLPHIYSNAEILLYPSLYEGFGLPILEAYATRTPVITSNVSTIKEVAGDGAILVDPKNIEEIAKSIDNLISNNDLRQKLIERGESIAKKYSWEKTAERVKEIIARMDNEISSPRSF